MQIMTLQKCRVSCDALPFGGWSKCGWTACGQTCLHLEADPVLGLSLASGSVPAWNEVMGGGPRSVAIERSKIQNSLESLSH